MDDDRYAIKVSQREAYTFNDKSTLEGQRGRFYTFHSMQEFGEDKGGEEPNMDVSRPRRLQRWNSTHTGKDPHLTECDLWENDAIAHTECREGYIMSPEVGGYGAYDVEGNREGRLGHRRRVTVDGSLLVNIPQEDESETTTIKDRLHGFVRQASLHRQSSHHQD